jgi:aldehyde:ferredoxin oxidoreductase
MCLYPAYYLARYSYPEGSPAHGSGYGVYYEPEEVWKPDVKNLAWAFNVREGSRRTDDTLPERLMTEPLKADSLKGRVTGKDDLRRMLGEYYTARGWNFETGTPTRAKLDN